MITNLKEKLSGNIPITREELFFLVSSWGRNKSFVTTNDNINVCDLNKNMYYPLENLDA